METLKEMMIENGTVVPLFTSDGPWGDALSCGSISGTLPTVNFGSKAMEQFDVLSKYTKGGPLMCMEFWVGWFDAWGGEKHMTSDLEDNLLSLRNILQRGSVNIYMFHGGTNFGFMNGSNYYDALTPDVTSYDYDALLTESGEITPKYEAFQKVIQEFTDFEKTALSGKFATYTYGELMPLEKVNLYQVLDELTVKKESTYPKSMERVGQNYGYILYRTTLNKEKRLETIRLWDTNDRAQIFMDNHHVVTLYDRELLEEVTVDVPIEENSRMDILVENMGRVNFGPKMEKQRKGIDGGVQINGHLHFKWEHYPLELDNIDRVDYTKGYEEGLPAFYRFEFEAEVCCDTYLDFTGWGKGCAFINGFNLGRFWKIGPQKRLYIPGTLIRKGKNSIVVFETEGITRDRIVLAAEPALE